jgi:hypothetical protein
MYLTSPPETPQLKYKGNLPLILITISRGVVFINDFWGIFEKFVKNRGGLVQVGEENRRCKPGTGYPVRRD